MKRIMKVMVFVMAICLIGLGTCKLAKAEGSVVHTSGWFTYTVNDQGQLYIKTVSYYYYIGTTMTIPEKLDNIAVYGIAKGAITGNDYLQELIIPGNVKVIEGGAVSYCNNLNKITFGEGVETIGSLAFEDCDALETVMLPASVIAMNGTSFYDCDILKNVFVAAKNNMYLSEDGVVYSKDKTSIIKYPQARKGEFSILQSITSIDTGAFEHCNELTKIIIPNTVTQIGNQAFVGCSKLKEIKLPTSLNVIGSNAFQYCNKLAQILIPKNVTTIGDSAFASCSKLKTANIPAKVSTLGFNIFAGCKALTDITVNRKNEAYSSQEGIVFNKSQTEILCYPAGKKDTSYTVEPSVEKIANKAFEGARYLKTVEFAYDNITLGEEAFANCSALKEMSIPKSVIVIPNNLFLNCIQLSTVVISEGVTSISESAFVGCSDLSIIMMPDSVQALTKTVFDGCSPNVTLYVSEGSTMMEFAVNNGIDYVLQSKVPQQVKISKLIKKAATSAVLKWKKNTIADGYEIYLSKKKTSEYDKVKTIKGGDVTTYTKTNLKKGNTYYFKIRAYKMVDDMKITGEYSTVKKIKIKK